MIFPAGDQPAEVWEPGKKTLHLPSSAVAAQSFTILCFAPFASIGGDHLDPVFFLELFIEFVGVTGFIPDEVLGEFVEKASGQN
jgi:hypothetical protein